MLRSYRDTGNPRHLPFLPFYFRCLKTPEFNEQDGFEAFLSLSSSWLATSQSFAPNSDVLGFGFVKHAAHEPEFSNRCSLLGKQD